jgi:phage gp46-like protein
MKSKEEILEGYFGSDYWLLKERDDLQYILRAMDEYAKQKLQHGVICKRLFEIEQIIQKQPEGFALGNLALPLMNSKFKIVGQQKR